MKKRNPIHLTITILAALVLVGLVAYSVTGNRTDRDIIGVWVTDADGTETGFQCASDGMAASVRNSTTQYISWEISHHRLILHGKRFENRHVYDIADTLAIKRISSKSLTIEHDGKTVNYRKTR